MSEHKSANKKNIKNSKKSFRKVFSEFTRSRFGQIFLSISLVLVLVASALGYFLYNESQTPKTADAAQGCASGWQVKVQWFPSTPTVRSFSYTPDGTKLWNDEICYKVSGPCTGAPATSQYTWQGASGACNYYPIGTGGGCNSGTNPDPLNPGVCISAQQKIDRDRGYSGPFDGSGTRNCWRVTYQASRPDGCTSNGTLKLPACDNISRYAGGNSTIDFIPNVPIINGCTCTNGAINYPSCNQCSSGFQFNGSSCVPVATGLTCGIYGNVGSNYANCQAYCNANFQNTTWNGSSCVSNTCPNGAINPPNCNQCPSGQSLISGRCTNNSCPNGAINPPNCNQCNSGFTYNGVSCVPTVPTSCPPGQFLNDTVCTSCPANTYKSDSTANKACTPCPAGATSPTGATSINQCSCPSGQQLQGSQCVIIIIPAIISDSTDCTVNTIVIIPQTKTCTFIVNGTGPFYLPPNTTGAFNTATGTGACSLSGSTITCLDIPSLNGTPGQQNILLAIGGINPTPKGKVTLALPQIPSIVGNSQDCTENKLVLIGNTFDCTFPLSGSFSLPSGTTANVEGLNGSGNCQIVNVIGGGQAISCTFIPTLGGTVGVKNVILNIPGYQPGAKGKVTLARYIVPADVDPTPNNGPTGNGAVNCKSQTTNSTNTVIIGDLVTCTFKVNTNDPVILPPNTNANISTATGNSDNCTYDNITKIITCINIPSNGGQPGDRNVNLNIPNNPSTPKGTVTLVSPAELLIPTANTTFSPTEANSKKFKDLDLSLTISDNRIVNGASCTVYQTPYPNKSIPNAAYSTVLTTNYTNGQINYVLPGNQQLVPKWRFKVSCVNPNTATNGYAGRTFTAFPDYAFKYGAIIVVEISGTVF